MSASAPTTKYFAIDTLDAAVVDPATAANPAEMFPQRESAERAFYGAGLHVVTPVRY